MSDTKLFVKSSIKYGLILLVLILAAKFVSDAIINSNKENCNSLGMHLGAEKYEWIPSHGCWIDGKRYYP